MIELRAKDGDWTLLKIDGPVRLAEADELLQNAKLVAADSRGIEIDLGSAEHIHAAGLQVLRALERLCQTQQRRFRFGAVSDKAGDALALCGLGHWNQPVRSTEDGA